MSHRKNPIPTPVRMLLGEVDLLVRAVEDPQVL